jgi:hypothetical protein
VGKRRNYGEDTRDRSSSYEEEVVRERAKAREGIAGQLSMFTCLQEVSHDVVM